MRAAVIVAAVLNVLVTPASATLQKPTYLDALIVVAADPPPLPSLPREQGTILESPRQGQQPEARLP